MSWTRHRAIGAAFAALVLSGCAPMSAGRGAASYHADLLDLVRANTAYRRVLFTGERTQLVIMSILPGESVGAEQHGHVEQILFCAAGHGKAVVGGVKTAFAPGDVVVVTPGVRHELVNDGAEPLQIYTIYSPPNHLPGRVQQTRAEADADLADEAFGRQIE